MPKLYIFRHAEAEPYASDEAGDFKRRLVPLGHRQSAESGAWIKQQLPAFDYVLCSDAARTRDTLEHAKLIAKHIEYTRVIYDVGATAQEMTVLYALFKNVPADAQNVLLVGHNPTAPQLALDIDKGANAELYAQLDKAFGKGAVAIVDIYGPWADVPSVNGRLETVFTPAQA